MVVKMRGNKKPYPQITIFGTSPYSDDLDHDWYTDYGTFRNLTKCSCVINGM